MKKAILSIAIAILGVTSAQAQVNCEQVNRLAKSVMSARQSGVALSDMLKVLDSPDIKTSGPLTRAVIMEAFEHPRYNTESVQQRTITEFASQHMLMCIKIMNQ